MSVTVVSKLDIDVLVHLAVHGPLEAEGWRPLDQRPDESGRRLWQQNWDRAGFEDEERPRIEEYAFVPMPCSITLAEGFAHLGYYTYQTAEEFGRGWYSSFAGRYVERIRTQLEANLAGVGQAPWGWTARDVRERLERGGVPALRVQGPAAAPDPLIASVESVFAERGIVLTRLDQPGVRRPGGLVFGPETVVAGWEVRVASTAEHPAADALPALQVWLFAEEEAARSTYRAYTRRHQDERWSRPHGVSRTGRVVVYWSHFNSGGQVDLLQGGLVALGEPDEHWVGRPPREEVGPVEVVAVRVLTAEGAGSGVRYIVVARTRKDLERLAGLIVDEDVRRQALQIDLSRRSVALLVGVASVDPGGRVLLQELVEETPDGAFTSDDTVTEITLDLEAITVNAASLITLPRLPRQPRTARVFGPKLTTSLRIM